MPKPYLAAEELAGLTPGVLDEAAVDFFANGHCASMALALHRRSGWDIVCFEVLDQSGHAVVHSPLGYLDARGIITVEQFAAGRELAASAVRVTFHWLTQPLYYAEENLELVMPFARAVLMRFFPIEFPRGLRGRQLSFSFSRGENHVQF